MIGIIGQGFVGNAVYQKFKNYYDVKTFDLDRSKSNSTFNQVANCEYVFVCLPTPMNTDGSCDISIVEGVIEQLDQVGSVKTIVIKSTIVPKTTEIWDKKFKAQIVFNPEFLTEKNAVADYNNQNRIILGGSEQATADLEKVFAKVFPDTLIVKTDSTSAEMVKYLINTFLSVKVSFANEMYQLCQSLNIDYDKVIEYAKLDERLGDSHWRVPNDGDFGFGGSCFPKDLSALIYLTEELQTVNNVLKATQKTNNKVRVNKI